MVDKFGQGVVGEDGRINRKALGSIVFGSKVCVGGGCGVWVCVGVGACLCVCACVHVGMWVCGVWGWK